jgi:predicted nucleotidyltransferase
MRPSTTEDQALLAAFRCAVLAEARRKLAAERAESEALRARVLPLVQQAVASARAAGFCGRVWLFGSFAWGQPEARSDLDLLVEGDDGEVAYRVGKACGLEVHALRVEQAPATLRARCDAEGLLL